MSWQGGIKSQARIRSIGDDLSNLRYRVIELQFLDMKIKRKALFI